MADHSTVLGQNYVKVPSGTTAERPANPADGYIRYNTTIQYLEYYSNGTWAAVAPPPSITGVSPATFNGEQGTSFTITGSFFDQTAVVKFITQQNVELAAATTYVNASTLYATTPRDFTVSEEPLSVKVLNGSGLSYTISAAIDAGTLPYWVTADGATLTTKFVGTTLSTSVSAADSDVGSSISYSVVSGALPGGCSLNSANGVISGTPNTAGTFTFGIRVTDNAGNYADRTFVIVINSVPTGGTRTNSGLTYTHRFTSTDNFYTPATLSGVEVLMVAGGGSGGSGNTNEGGGGGGAGGLLYGTMTINAGTYTASIGAGGAYGGRNPGNNTTFYGLTANAGGFGADCSGGGGTGGSGGGGSGCGQDWPGGSANQGAQGSLSGFGNGGGLGHWTGGGPYHSDGQGGGGGGAGSVGQEYRTNGSGRTYGISGSNVTYSTGGYGGAGRSGAYCGVNGAANTGNGGEGSVICNPAGGSGVVIVRYTLS